MARRQMLTEDERRSRLVDADGREPQHAPPRRQAPRPQTKAHPWQASGQWKPSKASREGHQGRCR
jgi:hypothetical protein